MTPVSRAWTKQWDVEPTRTRSAWRAISPPQLFVSSFVVLIALGSLALKLLPGVYTAEPLSWLDAIFTITSAVCVTGLTVADTATRFTGFGQAIILLFIQLGGLGVITFSTLIIISLGRRMSLRHEVLSTSTIEVAPHVDVRRLSLDVVRFTIILEAVGALLLFLLWIPRLGPSGAIWPAIFHAVSAFCNAGFSIFGDNLIGFQKDPDSRRTLRRSSSLARSSFWEVSVS
jgi:trk system potassium uptake protein